MVHGMTVRWVAFNFFKQGLKISIFIFAMLSPFKVFYSFCWPPRRWNHEKRPTFHPPSGPGERQFFSFLHFSMVLVGRKSLPPDGVFNCARCTCPPSYHWQLLSPSLHLLWKKTLFFLFVKYNIWMLPPVASDFFITPKNLLGSLHKEIRLFLLQPNMVGKPRER